MAEGALKPWEMDFGSSGGDKKPWEMSFEGASPAPRAEALPPPLTGGAPKAMDLATSAANPSIGAGIGEAALNMGTGMVAKPASDIAGLAAVARDMFSKKPGGDPQGFQREVQQRMTYEPRTPMGQKFAQYNPLALLAKLFGAAGDKAEQVVAPPESSGPARAAIGSGVGEGVKQLPALLGLGAPPAAAAAGRGVKDMARGTMQSALKPPIADLKSGKAGRAIDTLLDEGANVTSDGLIFKGGREKLGERIEKLDDRISGLIDNSPAVIDKQLVGYYVHSAFDKFKNQVDKAPDIASIQKVYDRFLADISIPDKIPVKQAQELKQGTYRALGQKAYGELKGAEIEAQKALARGLKEEIARAVPEVRKLNAEESKLLEALPIVERRILHEANKNPVGLGIMAGNAEKFALWMVDRSGLFKSLVARMLNTGSEALPALGAAGPAAGVAVSQDRQQLPPPPR